MKFSKKTIEYIRGIITGDLGKTNYLTGPKLIDFFSQFGFEDDYAIGFPSRWIYCEDKLTQLNNKNRIDEVIISYYSPVNFIENREKYLELIKELNDYLFFDSLVVNVDTRKISLQTVISSENPFVVNVSEGSRVTISIREEIYFHIKDLLDSGHYFHAVEESYKIVRQKLRIITGEEQAHKGFKEDNYELIFGHVSSNDAEKDFFEGVKFLHMAIQNLRNEKAHTPAKELDKNLAIHYIVLASLAYDLIARNN